MLTNSKPPRVWRHETDEEREDRIADENTKDEKIEGK